MTRGIVYLLLAVTLLPTVFAAIVYATTMPIWAWLFVWLVMLVTERRTA